jgi:hypothetical protein
LQSFDKMTDSMPASIRWWRRLFLTLEAGVLIPVVLVLAFPGIADARIQSGVEVWLYLAGALYFSAFLFLLILSPFFLRSLRGVALAGWIIAFVLLLFSTLLPRL